MLCTRLALPSRSRAHDALAEHNHTDIVERRLRMTRAMGVRWTLAPPRVFPDRFELSLDNDCILWEMPTVVRARFERGEGCVIAEDVQTCFGTFAPIASELDEQGLREHWLRRREEVLARTGAPTRAAA